jgi:hypothetical protein
MSVLSEDRELQRSGAGASPGSHIGGDNRQRVRAERQLLLADPAFKRELMSA